MNSPQRTSYLFSVVLHIVLLFLFMLFKFNVEQEKTDFVTLGFGTFGKLSSPGSPGEKKDLKEKKVSEEKLREEIKKEEKKVELPKVINPDENEIALADTKKKEKEEKKQAVEPVKKQEESSSGESVGADQGSYGFEINFGGKGKRRIYSYTLPSYPEGVSKEIDVKLKFSILPDGTVGMVTPLIKADMNLESAAINSLKKWRFEPLPNSQKQALQSAVIVFPYRLR